MANESIAVFHPRLGFGGSEAFAMWTVEALKQDYRVALIAGGAIDLERLNQFYGTSIESHECETVSLRLPWPLARVEWGAALRGSFADRARCDHIGRYDVLISAYNLADFGRPAIYHLADFSWDEGLRRRLDPPPGGLRRTLHVVRPLRSSYLRLSRTVAGNGAHNRASARGLVLANSHWSKEVLRHRHGIESEVLYPPIPMRPGAMTPARKIRRFVSLGRVYPEKRIEVIVDIVKSLRARGHDLGLHIVGDMRETAYGREVERRCHAEGPWIALEGRLFGAAKARLLADSAYGIHARPGEAFGIAVAEMMAARCLPFVPSEGGPAEIVGHHRALTYTSPDEAVRKIDAMLRDPALELDVRAAMETRAAEFSPQAFMRGIRGVVERFVRENRRCESILPPILPQ